MCDRQQGLIAGACVTQATNKAEREAAVELIEHLPVRRRRIQVAADKVTTRRCLWSDCAGSRPRPR